MMQLLIKVPGNRLQLFLCRELTNEEMSEIQKILDSFDDWYYAFKAIVLWLDLHNVKRVQMVTMVIAPSGF